MQLCTIRFVFFFILIFLVYKVYLRQILDAETRLRQLLILIYFSLAQLCKDRSNNRMKQCISLASANIMLAQVGYSAIKVQVDITIAFSHIKAHTENTDEAFRKRLYWTSGVNR